MEEISMRDRIKALATELLIRHGYHGVSFGDLADALGITRANIHYHFGNKLSLVDEVLEDYIRETSARFREIWTDPSTSFFRKIEVTIEYNRSRYLKFNREGNTGRPWSLIARMRQDSEVLGDRGRAVLKVFGIELHAHVVSGIEAAKARGELVASAPVEDIALQIVAIVNSAGPITQDAGSFDRLEQLYLAVGRVVMHAYGQRDASPTRRPSSRPPRERSPQIASSRR